MVLDTGSRTAPSAGRVCSAEPAGGGQGRSTTVRVMATLVDRAPGGRLACRGPRRRHSRAASQKRVVSRGGSRTPAPHRVPARRERHRSPRQDAARTPAPARYRSVVPRRSRTAAPPARMPSRPARRPPVPSPASPFTTSPAVAPTRLHHAGAAPSRVSAESPVPEGLARYTTRSTRSSPYPRWVISTTVRAPAASRISSVSARAVGSSRCSVGSSSTSTGRSASSARARASRCRWPPDSDSPCSPIRVPSPQGRS